MRYSLEPRERIYVKGYGFLSFAKNRGKNVSNKFDQRHLDSAKKSTTDAIKSASKRAIQKKAEACGDLIGNKTADKITSVSAELRSTKKTTENNNTNNETKVPKERYISPEKRKQIIDESRFV